MKDSKCFNMRESKTATMFLLWGSALLLIMGCGHDWCGGNVRLYVLFAMLGLSGCIHFGIVGPDDFLSLRPGMSLADVRVRLGSSKLHHHFTVERGGHMWQLFRCYLSAGHAQRDILFRDGRFVKHVDVTRAVSFRTIRDDNWAGGLFVKIPWCPTDYTYVDQVIGARDDDAARAALRRDVELARRPSNGSGIPSLNALPLIVFAPFVLLEGLWVPPAMVAHARARGILDGVNFRIGETQEEISRRLGKPATCRRYAESGVEVWSYAYTDLARFVPWSEKALRLVLIFQSDRVKAIYNTDPYGSRYTGDGWLVSPSWFRDYDVDAEKKMVPLGRRDSK